MAILNKFNGSFNKYSIYPGLSLSSGAKLGLTKILFANYQICYV